jgi:N6-adenosine-specific RNA methylase IME4
LAEVVEERGSVSAALHIEPLRPHPAAEAFPMMDPGMYEDLKDDIEAFGQREPITLCDGMILDGRNRYKACLEIGVEPSAKEFNGNPWDYVWSLNGARRDLVAEQRYLIWKYVSGNSAEWLAEQSRIQEAASAGRAKASAEQPRNLDGTLAAKPIVDHSDPQSDRHAGREGRATLSGTNPGAVARGDKLWERRRDLADQVRVGVIRPAEAHRQMKRDEVSSGTVALPMGKYTVIYADPPWKYNDGRSGERMTATGALHHYPTMTLSELKALPIDGLAAENSVLFMWATSPLLPDALELSKAWGFKYKASFVWDKVKHNMGHYNSVRHEFLLVCTRGSCTPQNVKLFDSVLSIPKSKKHSEKPERFRKIIQTLYPKGPKIELFRRGKAPIGWSAWGNENV